MNGEQSEHSSAEHRYRSTDVDSLPPESQPSQVKSLYAKIADVYAERYFDDLSDAHLVDRLLERLPPNAKVIDVGCGPGTFTKYASEKGFAAEGIDLSPVMVEVASRRVPECEFLEMDVRHLEYSNGSFDAVVAAYSLIHVSSRDMRAALDELHRVLKPEGWLLVIGQTGDPDHVEDDPLAPGEVVFVNFFAPERLRGQLVESGFVVDELDTKTSDDDTSMSSGVVWALARRLT